MIFLFFSESLLKSTEILQNKNKNFWKQTSFLKKISNFQTGSKESSHDSEILSPSAQIQVWGEDEALVKTLFVDESRKSVIQIFGKDSTRLVLPPPVREGDRYSKSWEDD